MNSNGSGGGGGKVGSGVCAGNGGFRSYKTGRGYKIEIFGLKTKRCSQRDLDDDATRKSNLQDLDFPTAQPYPYQGVFTSAEMKDTTKKHKIPPMEEILWKPKAGIVTAKSFHNNKNYDEFQSLVISGFGFGAAAAKAAGNAGKNNENGDASPTTPLTPTTPLMSTTPPMTTTVVEMAAESKTE